MSQSSSMFSGAANETVQTERLPQAAVIGAILAFVGNFIILNVGRAFGTAFEVLIPGTSALQPLPVWPSLVVASIVAAAGGAVVLMLLSRRADIARPITVFGIVSLVVFLLSLYGPTEANTDSASTILGLNIMHGWTALAVVGSLASSISGEEAA